MSMQSITKICSLILILFINISISNSGVAQISFDNPQIINAKSGLPTDMVYAVCKDDMGFVWLATSDGVCRWDGLSVRVFQHDPADSSSISGNSIAIHAFLWDETTKKLIIGTNNGLSFFDPRTLKAENFTAGDDNSRAFLSGIQALLVDRQHELWIGTDAGLVKFQRNDGTFSKYYYSAGSGEQFPTDIKRVNLILDIKQDYYNDSILWLGTLEGLLKFNKYSKKFSRFYYNNKNYRHDLNTFKKVVTHSNRKLYLGTWNADMVVFNTSDDRFEKSFGPYTSSKCCRYPSPVKPYAEKSANELWISSRNGIGVFNTLTEEINTIRSFKNTEGSTYAPDIAYISSDKTTMWLSSEYGAFRCTSSGHLFDNYFFPPVNEDLWFLTSSFYEDTVRKRLYIGYSRGQGLHYFDLAEHTFHIIPLPERPLKEIIIRDFLPTGNNTLLVLSADAVYKFSLTDEKFTPLSAYFPTMADFKKFISDHQGRIWVSSTTHGIQELDPVTGALRNIEKIRSYFDQNKSIPDFYDLIVDKYDKLWFRSGKSYGYYAPDQDSFYYFLPERKTGIVSFYAGKQQDTIWAGTAKNGLGFLIPDHPEKGWQMYHSSIHKRIYSLLRDSLGDFIMLTSGGIEKLVPGRKQAEVFNQNDGLVKFDKWANRDPTIPGKLFRLHDGRFVIGYRRGLGFFYPENLHKTTETLAPYISSLKVFGQEMLDSKDLFSTRELPLNYDQNFLTFNYSALAVNDGQDILLAHKLTGIDRDWVKSGRHSISYSNLQPGNYRFIVKAENRSMPGLFKETSLDIVIHPPWWNTWWAIGLFILLSISFVYIIYRYQLSRILARKEAARLKEVDKLKSRLYANITHEFRTPLTVIKGITGEIAGELSEKEQKRLDDKLSMINRNSDKLLHLVQQMLDMSKIEEGKMKLNLIRDNIVSYLQYVLESFQSMADSKNIKLVFYHETDQVVMDYDQDKIFVIASNLLSNAIKFTPKGGKVIFHVKKETENDKDKLIIKVQDSGIGIRKEHLPHIFDRFYQVDNTLTRKNEGTGIGLALTKELVELMNGDITVKSTPHERTEFCVSLPITQKAPLQKPKAVEAQWEGEQERTVDLAGGTDDNNLPLALIIEDNADVAKYIVSCFAGKYRVKWSPDGEQGIKTAIEVIPDIIISDVMMPGKDGFEVCETLKKDEHTSHIPIVLLTAKATDADRIEGLSHGADAYLTKPFNKKELFVRLEQLIKIRRQLHEKYSKVEISLAEKAEPAGEERFLKKAVSFIEQNLDDPGLNASILAKHLHMSESQLYRKLKALSGKSTAVFIRSIRLSAAKRLLESSEFNISEIAYQCGFNDPAWFSRVFKEEYGVSPSSFRK